MPTARNPETGETFELVGNKWVLVEGSNAVAPVAAEQSAANSLAIGAGRRLTEYGRGVQNLAASALGLALPEEAGQIKAQLRTTDASERASFAELERLRPYSTFAGGLAVDVATLPLGVAEARVAGGGARQLGRVLGEQSGIGAAQGGLGYQPQVADQFLGALLGGTTTALAGGAGEVLGRVRGMFRTPETTVQRAERLRGSISPGPLEGTFTQDTMQQLQARAAATGRSIEEILTGAEPLPGSLERARLMARGEKMGFLFSTGERLNSGPLRQLEAARGSNPLTSTLDIARKEKNQGVLNKLALEAIGEAPARGVAPEFREAALGRAANRIGAEFEGIAGQSTIWLDQHMVDQLAQIQGAATSTSIKAGDVRAIIDRFVDLTGPDLSISGTRLLSERSDMVAEMSKAARSDAAGSGRKAQLLRELVRSIDDGIIRQLDPELGRRYATAREQFRMWSVLDQPGMVQNGRVQGQRFANKLRRDYPSEFRRGDQYGTVSESAGRLFDAARITSEFRDIVGDSGTATRSALMNFLRDPQRGMTANIAGGVIDLAIQRGAEPLGRRVGPTATALPVGVGGALGRVLGVPTEADLLQPALQPQQ